MTALNIRGWLPATSRGQFWMIWGLVAVAGFLAYANSFTAALTIDSGLVIPHDPRIQSASFHSLRAIFTEDYWRPTYPSDLYRPLTTLSFLVNYRIFGNGPNPAGYHWVNLAIHLANAGWIVWLAMTLSRSAALGLAAGLIFATHPVTVEAVTNIVGRADLLAAFFVLTALYCHWQGYRWGLVAATIAGILSKENAIAVVPVILALDLVFFRERMRAPAPRYWPLLPVLALFCAIQLTIGRSSPVPWQAFVDNPIAGAPVLVRFMTACAVQTRYLGLLFWPARLSCDYSYDQIPLFGTGDATANALSWIFLAAIAGIGWLAWRWRANRLFCFGVLAYGALLVPTANLFKVIGSIMAERFLYLPLIGFVCAIAAAAGLIAQSLRRPQFVIGFGLAASVALIARTFVRNRDWQTELSIWRSAAAVSPESFKPHQGLAAALTEADSSERTLDLAIAEAKKGLAILDRPEVDQAIERRTPTLFVDFGKYYQSKADFRRAAGDEAGARADLEQAVVFLQRAVVINDWISGESRRILLSRGVPAERIHPIGLEPIFHSLGVAEMKLGRPAEALPSAISAVTLNPFDSAAFEFLAACENRMHRTDAAIQGLYLAILANSQFSQAWDELGALYARRSPGTGPIWRGTGDARILDANNPTVRPDLLRACRCYDRLLRQSAYTTEADDFRAFAARAFHCTPADFAGDSSGAGPLAAFTP